MGWTGAHWGGVFLDPTPNDPFEGFRTSVVFFVTQCQGCQKLENPKKAFKNLDFDSLAKKKKQESWNLKFFKNNLKFRTKTTKKS